MDEIMGKPFAWLGRGPAAFYCLGIWIYLVEVIRGIQIQDPFENPTPAALREFWRRFIPLELEGELRPLDLLFWRWGAMHQAHVVTVLSSKWTASIDQWTGVHRLPLADARRRAEGAYRLQELA